MFKLFFKTWQALAEITVHAKLLFYFSMCSIYAFLLAHLIQLTVFSVVMNLWKHSVPVEWNVLGDQALHESWFDFWLSSSSINPCQALSLKQKVIMSSHASLANWIRLALSVTIQNRLLSCKFGIWEHQEIFKPSSRCLLFSYYNVVNFDSQFTLVGLNSAVITQVF